MRRNGDKMKLKNVLFLTFLILTLIPTIIISILLYKSGLQLSKESYNRNLEESINVQADYLSQIIENDMIADYRFIQKNSFASSTDNFISLKKEKKLLEAFQSYLEVSEDKITVCALLDKEDRTVYTIGEESTIARIQSQLPQLSKLTNQMIMEFELSQDVYSLGILTPIWNEQNEYIGSFISIYDKAHLFKSISSYYKIADTSTYICRESGAVIHFRKLFEEEVNLAIEKVLIESPFLSEGRIDHSVDDILISGYYKKIYNSPWYLVGFIDQSLIYNFTHKYMFVYILIILFVLVADIVLSLSFSKRVVAPINSLVAVMDKYQNNLNDKELEVQQERGYRETNYLHIKFFELMKKILLVQHNFEGVYKLYQSGDMDDINVDIDVKNQTIETNKEAFHQLIEEVDFSQEDCIVEKFTRCFCEKDREVLLVMFEKMRDNHLAVTCETEVYTPYLNQKWFHILVVPMYTDERLSRIFVQLRDISNFRKQEFESVEQARRDPLTGLYNRSGFSRKVEQILQEKGTATHGLFFIDMNYFKLVNDNFGHKEGDQLLCSIGQTLLEFAGSKNIAARLGGDEFGVFLSYTSVEEIEKEKEKLNKRLIYPYHTDQFSFSVSASIGIAVWNYPSSVTLEELLHQADAVMYQTKREFKQTEGKL